MSEETKEYLKRVDELELKLTGDDKDTFQWVLFGYNECARILEETEQENQQLKEELQKADSITQSCIFEGKEESEINFRKAINLIEQYKSVLDEIREYIDGVITIWETNPSTIATLDLEYLLQQIDKVKENERGTTKVS